MQDSDGDTALNNAIIIEQLTYRDPKIVDLLASSDRTDFTLRNNKGCNALQISVFAGNIRSVLLNDN